MQAGTILFNSVDLSRIGHPTLRIQRSPDPAPPAAATRQRVTLTVVIQLDTHDPSTQQARLEYLQETMEVREGILRSESPSGHYLEWMATPAGDTLGEAMAGRSNSITLNFSALEAHPDAQVESLISATLELPDETLLTFHALRDFNKQIATERVALLSSARKLTTTTISFAGRVLQTNPADDEATRWAALRAAQQNIESANARYGTLATGGISTVVRVQSLIPRIDEERMALDVDVTCFRTDIPGNDAAVIEIDETVGKDEGSGEVVHRFSGTITAEDEATALAQLDIQITAKKLATGGRVSRIQFTPTRTAAGDTSTEEWIGTMPFSFECRVIQGSVDAYKVKVSTSDSSDGRRLTISGEIRGTDQASVLAKAKAVAAAFTTAASTRTDETLDYVTPVEETAHVMTVLQFSYEYRTNTVEIRASFESTESRGAFSDHTDGLSGSITTTSHDAARGILKALIPAGVCLRAKEERESYTISGAKSITIGGGLTPAAAETEVYFAGYDQEGFSVWTSDGTIPGAIPSYPYAWLRHDSVNDFWLYTYYASAATDFDWTSEETSGTDPLPGTTGDWYPGINGNAGALDLTFTEPTQSFASLGFSYGWFVAHTERSVQYRDTLSVNEADMTEERTISGTARGSDAAAAQAAIDALLTELGLDGSNPVRYTRGDPYEVCGTDPAHITNWIAREFSYTFVGKASTPGNDIIAASVSMRRTGAINRPIIHPIPYSRPIVQTDTGWTIATITISASCKARTAAAARGFVQDQRTLVSGIGSPGNNRHEIAAPDEGFTDDFAPFEGGGETDTFATRTFTGRYSFAFSGLVANMDGTWPAALD